MTSAAYSSITLTLVDQVRVVVPDSLDIITPYVLQEQHDWFEDEIKFLRRLLQPGQKVIDIGANYGVYALSIARTVGSGGQVWAFEPASNAAQLLAEGIDANGFTQVIVDKHALTSTVGVGHLALDKDPEANALIHGKPSTTSCEAVEVTTIDERLDRYGWKEIDFVKIDAEGEELNILKGGTEFFARFSPLIQYEIKAGADLHLELVDEFAAMGYRSYRLVPRLELLVPFDPKSVPDAYLLNLFCCKPDRARKLAEQGFLLDEVAQSTTTEIDCLRQFLGNTDQFGRYHWRNTLVQLPYGSMLAELWHADPTNEHCPEVVEALAFYAISRDAMLPASIRYSALHASLALMEALCQSAPSHLRLGTLARVAQDFGSRLVAVKALIELINTILGQNKVDPSEPFLPPSERFDSIAPGSELGNWVLASLLEEVERIGNYSSYYSGAAARSRLEDIRDLGFGSEEMRRRLHLVQRRFGAVPS